MGSSDPAFLAFLLELFEGKLQARVNAAAQKGTTRQFAIELSEHYRLLLAGCAAVANLARRGGLDLSELEPPVMRSLKKLDGTLVGEEVPGFVPAVIATDSPRAAAVADAPLAGQRARAAQPHRARRPPRGG